MSDRPINSTTTAGANSPINSLASDPESATAWMADGNCRMYPPAAFFPSDGVGVDKARKVCADCPVIEPCLEYALEHRFEHGVWGGCSAGGGG
ncbi:MAG: WhiB family transcriptional regulator, partial [Ilumatobacteraceae bacterium]